MCQKCLDSAHQFFPEATEKECNEIIRGATFFPIVDHDTVHKHLKALSERCGGDWRRVFSEADAMCEEDMKEMEREDKRMSFAKLEVSIDNRMKISIEGGDDLIMRVLQKLIADEILTDFHTTVSLLNKNQNTGEQK